jgi:prolyl-tRNA editing enzyme YbaK/EbsC (Cys-tRNA(Pro) deacylase)
VELARTPVGERLQLVAEPVRAALSDEAAVDVAEIDPALADTAAFCERYGWPLERSANCVVVEARREGRRWLAACVILATTRADVNKLVKKTLGASKVSFATMEKAVSESGMEYGGITPIGLPDDWPVLVDRAVAESPEVVIGSGLRGSKLFLSGPELVMRSGGTVLDGLGG